MILVGPTNVKSHETKLKGAELFGNKAITDQMLPRTWRITPVSKWLVSNPHL